ncbi:homocitrate synthase [Clostridium sp. DJ247]|uniref:homocitrate synthase n=1 Tax=Clostridium sp. DJ247 TaxID=2726188 RepID=UPI00162999FA|nr:homocitrate synthase [Clostridium sp. DJ247]MBC2582420.1 homocitrate synthase [Clostridium sp. DJ247]
MSIKIVDTTLRDGEQKAGVALSINDKVEIAKIISDMGIFQIEAGIAAMGGDEKKSLEKIVELNLNSKISSWNRMSTKDIQHSIDCGVDIVHISIPSSDIQIKSKLAKDRLWVIDNIKKSVSYAKEKDCEVTVGLEDASRADMDFIIELCRIVSDLGVKRVRYADTVGILYPRNIFKQVTKIREQVPVEIEIHVHNDLGMAVANSVASISAGAEYIDCTIGGIGERAGNCNYTKFIEVLEGFEQIKVSKEDRANLYKLEEYIMNIIKYGAVHQSCLV